MKRAFFLPVPLFFLIGLVGQGYAQNTNDTLKTWEFYGQGGANFSQISLTNWAAGGDNSISGSGLLNLHLHYKKNKTTWENDLELAYGLIKQGEEQLIKSDDKIDFSSKFGINASKKWYYTLMAGFKTQFDKGYDYPNDSVVISDFMAPAYIITSLGMDFKPNDNLSVLLSPATSKITIVNDQTLANQGAFGVEPDVVDTTTGQIITEGERTRFEFGGFLKFGYNKEVFKNISFETKLELFSNYAENPENIDVNWENLITLKVNDYISANIKTHLIYDDDVKIAIDDNDDGQPEKMAARTQFKQVFGIGLSYKF